MKGYLLHRIIFNRGNTVDLIDDALDLSLGLWIATTGLLLLSSSFLFSSHLYNSYNKFLLSKLLFKL